MTTEDYKLLVCFDLLRRDFGDYVLRAGANVATAVTRSTVSEGTEQLPILSGSKWSGDYPQNRSSTTGSPSRKESATCLAYIR